NINSLVWNTMRFKPPPTTDEIGWRIEFRPMDLQMTDFENAALSTFIALLTRAILSYNISTLIPISKVDENMERAQKRDAIHTAKFYFKKVISTDQRFNKSSEIVEDQTDNCEYCLMSINEIMNGSTKFFGLIPLVEHYLDELEEIDVDTRYTLNQYINLIRKRADGTLLTDATWMRQFVQSHPSYKQDSIVTDEIQYDLLWKIQEISNDGAKCPSVILEKMTTKTNLDVYH
ncbi:unnamed protein product, partial [Didymodactylos carnosus]